MRMTRDEVAVYDELYDQLPAEIQQKGIEASGLDQDAYTLPGLLFQLWDEKELYLSIHDIEHYYRYFEAILAKMPNRVLNEGVYKGKVLLLHALDRADLEPRSLELILAVTADEGVNAVFEINGEDRSALSIGLEKGISFQYWIKLVRLPLYNAYPSLQLALGIIQQRRASTFYSSDFLIDCQTWLDRTLSVALPRQYPLFEFLYTYIGAHIISLIPTKLKAIEAADSRNSDEIFGFNMVDKGGYVEVSRVSGDVFVWQTGDLSIL